MKLFVQKKGPLTQNPKLADGDPIGAIRSLAISAETERNKKFTLTNKGKSAKVFAVESAAEANTKKEQQKDQHILAPVKAVQADLAPVRSEVETLRETAINQKAGTVRPSRAGNGVTTEARPPGCQECRRKKEGDRCPHCYLCSGLNHIARHCQTKHRNHQGDASRLPPRTGCSLAREREVPPV